MSFPFAWTRNTDIAASGFLATVPKNAMRRGVIELEAPIDRDLFVGAILIMDGPGAFLQRGPSSLITDDLVLHTNDVVSNFSSGLVSTAVERSGSSTLAPDDDGFIIPSNAAMGLGNFTLERFIFPLAVRAGEVLSMISESVNADIRYGFRWFERAAV